MIHFQGQLMCDGCKVGFLAATVEVENRLPRTADVAAVTEAADAAGWFRVPAKGGGWLNFCPGCRDKAIAADRGN